MGSVGALASDLSDATDASDAPAALGSARWALDSSVDAVRDRFGREAVGYLAARTRSRGVPADFRELAEHD